MKGENAPKHENRKRMRSQFVRLQKFGTVAVIFEFWISKVS